jgi:predicted nucleic acid-binding protein
VRAVLIDTSAWIQSMRRDGDAALRRQVEAAMLEGKARLCDLVRLELWNRVGGERERRWLQALEDTIETVATDSRVWSEARRLAETSRRLGLTTPSTDLLIAACARVHDLELLHCDAHFDRLQAIAGAD